MAEGGQVVKVNPKRKPATQYDVERARREGRYEGFEGLMGIFLWVRAEVFGDADSDLKKTQEGILYYCQEIKAGRLGLNDIISALQEEHGITIELTERRTP